MTITPSALSHGRGQTFAHGQEIANFKLNSDETITLTAHQGGFLIQMQEAGSDAWVINEETHDSLHEAMLATRQMAHDHGGSPTSPKLEDHEAGEELHSESINGHSIVLERSEAEEDLFWDVYATEAATGKTGDVQSYGPDEYLLALNAYDELYFEIECGNDPFQ